MDEGKAFHCFCKEEDLAAKKAVLEEQKLAPHYDGTCRKLSKEEVQKKLQNGEEAVIRFPIVLISSSPFGGRLRRSASAFSECDLAPGYTARDMLRVSKKNLGLTP